MTNVQIVQSTPSSFSLEVLEKGFLEDLRFEGAKINTIEKHARNFVIMRRHGMDTLETLTKEQAKHFLMQKRIDGRSVSTVRNFLKTLRRFGKWLERESFVKDNPFRDIPYPRQERKAPVIPSENDFQEIRRVILSLSKNGLANQRFLNFIDFLAFTGARITSGRCVRLGDIDPDRGVIKLEDPKNNSYYFFPIDERLRGLLEKIFTFRAEYLKEVHGTQGHQNAPTDFLFFAKHPSIAIAERTIRRQFQKLCDRLGKRVHPHMFRKYFAQQCYLKGLNQYEIQGLLNHSDLTMIQVYTQQDQGHLRTSLNRAFGRSEWNSGFSNRESPRFGEGLLGGVSRTFP